MKYLRLLKIHWFLLLLVSMEILFAQDPETEHQKYVESVMETLSENRGEEDDIPDLTGDMDNYSQNPLNINDASDEQLKTLNVLSEYQIAAILDYRKTKDPLMSLYEILYIPGFRQEDIERLQGLLTCAQPARGTPSYSKLFNAPKQQLTMRYQRVFEQQSGYKKLSDSVMIESPDRALFLGSPDKLFLRYKIECREILKAGIVMEKDPGEEFFKGSNRSGFDLYSANMAYSNEHSFLKNILLGDYNIQMGQGLLAWSSYSLGKTSYVDGIYKNSGLLRVNNSVEENRFLRGAAITIGWEQVIITFFASAKKIDATLADSSEGKDLFTGLVETGYHSTPMDLKKEDVLERICYGSSVRLKLRNLKLGVNGLYVHYNKNYACNDQLYKSYSYSGNNVAGASIDYRVLAGRAQIFGESAISNNHAALLNGLLIYLNPEISLGILHRHYDKEYYSYYSNAFGENTSVTNEDGFFLGSQLQFSNASCRAFVDLYSFPWLKYQVNTPSKGYEAFIECAGKVSLAEIGFRFDHKEKPQNTMEEEHLWVVGQSRREKYRLNSSIPVGPCIRLLNRFEIISAGLQNDTTFYGFYFAQDILIRKTKLPLEFTLRLVGFSTQHYDARIYAYERDVYTAGSSQMLYGKGWRYMVMIRWNANDKISCWLKIAQSRYPNEEKIGSGLTAIDGNHRTEIRLQLVFRL